MPSLSNKVRNALAEGVILMSIVEVLIGFGFNAFFQPGFGRLPPETQTLKFVGLVARGCSTDGSAPAYALNSPRNRFPLITR